MVETERHRKDGTGRTTWAKVTDEERHIALTISLRNLSQSSFKPRVVSIGPLHRKDENLQAFEGRKADFVHDLLRHKKSTREALQACVEQVAASIEQIKGCYAELMETYTDDELTEMMVTPTYYVSSYFPSSTIHSAVELHSAGVRFKHHQDTKWPMAMKVKTHRFSCFSWSWIKPTLSMPALRVNHFTELVLRNLIAYEQSSMVDPYVTSYAMAMDMLIDTKEDIDKLIESKVLINHLGSNEEATNMINKLCKELVWEYFFYGKQWDKLDKHCKRCLPRKILRSIPTIRHLINVEAFTSFLSDSTRKVWFKPSLLLNPPGIDQIQNVTE
ncbi:hypothetical protein CTI12_AA133070 [Artemisia annua]|uniref:Uncharacterized protein n=1 Tax=Artemisia annua TaxID=35608 RepID=A0A2U1NAV8_ARTAN|nr:hypothetical protein CTI12_AA133070 [Artemisia annua]